MMSFVLDKILDNLIFISTLYSINKKVHVK